MIMEEELETLLLGLVDVFGLQTHHRTHLVLLRPQICALKIHLDWG